MAKAEFSANKNFDPDDLIDQAEDTLGYFSTRSSSLVVGPITQMPSFGITDLGPGSQFRSFMGTSAYPIRKDNSAVRFDFSDWQGNLGLYGGNWNDILIGGSGNDSLSGGQGADTMSGGKGNDTYTVGDAGDRVIEAGRGGTDRVLSSVSFSLTGQYIETLHLTGPEAIDGLGNSLDNLITGNRGANRLSGGRGSDQLDGAGGADVLIGGVGDDVFTFSAGLVTGEIDHIKDFSRSASGNDDTIRLSQTVFSALAEGRLAAAAFKDLGVAGAVLDASDRILYDRKTGALAYDADGSGLGAAVPFAQLDNKPVISALDFRVGLPAGYVAPF